MHLTECIDLFSESNVFDYEVRECVYNWHFKTSTNFLNADLQLNLLFGALCWSFTFGGLSMLFLKPKWAHRSNFPYMTYAYTLIFIQGEILLSESLNLFMRFILLAENLERGKK